MPELKEFAHVADMTISAEFYSSEELADTSTAERTQLYKIFADGRAGWARLPRKKAGRQIISD